MSPFCLFIPRAGRRLGAALGAATALLALPACSGGGGDAAGVVPAAASAPPASAPALRAVTVARGLSHPWGLAFLPDGAMLVTERAGRLRLVLADGRVRDAPVTGLPPVDERGQGGLFDVVLAPDFAQSRRLYLSYAEPGSDAQAGRTGLAVARAALSADAGELTQWQVIFRQTPKVDSTGHYGGRLVPAPGDTLFVTLGDRQSSAERMKAQDLAAGHGKIMRIHGDGRVPADNPFVGRAGAQAAIWSYGHRNPQGAALHPETGELWASEHGPQGGDEINRVRPGLNYGWPLVSHGCEYGTPVGQCSPVGGASSGEGFEPPLTWWGPVSIAPSGLAFNTGSRYPGWRGQLFMGALAGRALWRLRLEGTAVVEREALLSGLGSRIRDVRLGPDGWLYLLTDEADGQLLRVAY